ncbi:hypothetical protein NE237_027032 [Protea cynaroides]|uniref:Uncharacterized protein n=1 Tax=Protea cynaroides TaxID=273540 RepID=A0A9Q0GPQ1_9MAGN|nr:hypothetical protein NE237_027032 [Protea cynaroides]
MAVLLYSLCPLKPVFSCVVFFISVHQLHLTFAESTEIGSLADGPGIFRKRGLGVIIGIVGGRHIFRPTGLFIFLVSHAMIKSLAAELCLDRVMVLVLLCEPPPNLVLTSAALPDKVAPVISEPERLKPKSWSLLL